MTKDHLGASESEEIEYDTFSIKILPKQDDAYPVSVSSCGGEGYSKLVLPSELSALGAETMRSREQVGGALFEALFSGDVGDLFDWCQGKMSGPPRRGLRIEIHLDPDEPSLAALVSLPWELLYHRRNREFFGISRYTPIVRYLDVRRPTAELKLEPPLRILVVMASPAGSPLDLERERKVIEEQLIPPTCVGAGEIEVDFLEHATVEKLQDRLRQRSPHVLHFMGHGVFDDRSGQGVLLVEDDSGGVATVDGSAFGDLLRDVPTLGLVFLNACDTARAASGQGTDPFAGVAAALVLAGIRAVVAMQLQISDRAAITFAKTFYQLLANGSPVDYATAQGRMAIRLDPRIQAEWSTPVLFMRVPGGVVFERVPSLPTVPLIQKTVWSDPSQESVLVEATETARIPATDQPSPTLLPTGGESAGQIPITPFQQRTEPVATAKPSPKKTKPAATAERQSTAEPRNTAEPTPETSRVSASKQRLSRLNVDLLVQPVSVQEGGAATWTITVSNAGDDDLHEVDVKIGSLSLGTFVLPVGEGRQMTGSTTFEGNVTPVVLHFVAAGLNSLGQEVRAEAQRAVEVRPRRKTQTARATLPKPAAPLSEEVAALLRKFKRHGLNIAPDIPPAKLKRAMDECQAPEDQVALGLIAEIGVASSYSCLVFGVCGIYYCNPKGALGAQSGPGSVAYADFSTCEFKANNFRGRVSLREGRFLDLRNVGVVGAVNINLIATILNDIKKLAMAR